MPFSGGENMWKIPPKYRLNSVSKAVQMPIFTGIVTENTQEIPSKYHQSSIQTPPNFHQNTAKIP